MNDQEFRKLHREFHAARERERNLREIVEFLTQDLKAAETIVMDLQERVRAEREMREATL